MYHWRTALRTVVRIDGLRWLATCRLVVFCHHHTMSFTYGSLSLPLSTKQQACVCVCTGRNYDHIRSIRHRTRVKGRKQASTQRHKEGKLSKVQETPDTQNRTRRPLFLTKTKKSKKKSPPALPLKSATTKLASQKLRGGHFHVHGIVMELNHHDKASVRSPPTAPTPPQATTPALGLSLCWAHRSQRDAPREASQEPCRWHQYNQNQQAQQRRPPDTLRVTGTLHIIYMGIYMNLPPHIRNAQQHCM